MLWKGRISQVVLLSGPERKWTCSLQTAETKYACSHSIRCSQWVSPPVFFMFLFKNSFLLVVIFRCAVSSLSLCKRETVCAVRKFRRRGLEFTFEPSRNMRKRAVPLLKHCKTAECWSLFCVFQFCAFKYLSNRTS